MGTYFRRRIKFATWATVVLTLLSICMLAQSGAAWKNGSYAYNSSSYSYSTDYGTHDWVADAALNALHAADATNWQWLVDREAIFLVGTEAPDNSGVSMTLDGTSVSGFGDTASHHIYFNEDGTIANNQDDAAVRAKTVGDLADAALNAQKRDLAAFYMGAMVHYIADMGVFCHVAENYVAPYNLNFDKNHTDYEEVVFTRTNEYSTPQEFFKIASFTVASTAPYDAAVNLGWDTYKDSAHSSAHDAVYLYTYFFGSWVSSYAARSGDSSAHQTYYDRVEQNLNNAIAACAAAMNYEMTVTTDIPAYPLPVFSVFALIAVLGLIGWKYRKNLL